MKQLTAEEVKEAAKAQIDLYKSATEIEKSAMAEGFFAGVDWVLEAYKQQPPTTVVEGETKALNEAYAQKILRQNKQIEGLKAEILRLHKQQLDVDWEVEADEAGLDKETQEHIIQMADNAIKSHEEDKSYVKSLEEENRKLKQRVASQAPTQQPANAVELLAECILQMKTTLPDLERAGSYVSAAMFKQIITSKSVQDILSATQNTNTEE